MLDIADLTVAYGGLRALSDVSLTVGVRGAYVKDSSTPPGFAAPLASAVRAGTSLPVYTVLIPAFREPESIGQLLAAIDALEYPVDRLDVKLLLEGDDHETLGAARAAGARPNAGRDARAADSHPAAHGAQRRQGVVGDVPVPDELPDRRHQLGIGRSADEVGELAEEECIRIESTFLEDDQVFEELLVVEAELAQDYVQGALTGNRRAAFEKRLLDGPGRLTKALWITNELNGKVTSKESGVWLSEGPRPPRRQIIPSSIIGVEYAGSVWALKPYRFKLDHN
jgi:cellulose synthase/poly-beta-1,6-N-acetylglucosamine synthase-like glycosyltransferase